MGYNIYDTTVSVFDRYTLYKFAVHSLKVGNIAGHDVEPILKRSIDNSIVSYDGGVYGDYNRYFSNNMFFNGMLPGVSGMDAKSVPDNAGLEVLKVGVENFYMEQPVVFRQVNFEYPNILII